LNEFTVFWWRIINHHIILRACTPNDEQVERWVDRTQLVGTRFKRKLIAALSGRCLGEIILLAIYNNIIYILYPIHISIYYNLHIYKICMYTCFISLPVYAIPLKLLQVYFTIINKIKLNLYKWTQNCNIYSWFVIHVDFG